MTQPNGRDQVKKDILSLLITKHNTSCLVADLRAEIDKKAKGIGLKPSERIELIMEMKKTNRDERKRKMNRKCFLMECGNDDCDDVFSIMCIHCDECKLVEIECKEKTKTSSKNE